MMACEDGGRGTAGREGGYDQSAAPRDDSWVDVSSLIVAILSGLTMGLAIGNMAFVLDDSKPESFVSHRHPPSLFVPFVGGAMQLGGIAGAAAAGRATDVHGRKCILHVVTWAMLVGCGVAAVGTEACVFVGRALCGLAIGLVSHVGPMYVNEVAPAHLRSPYSVCIQVFTNVGILLSYAGSAGAESAPSGYRYALAFPVPAAVTLLIALRELPESPRWLYSVGRDTEADKILHRIRSSGRGDGGACGGDDAGGRVNAIAAERAEITAALRAQALDADAGWRDLFDPRYRRGIATGVATAVFQTGVGIDMFTNYAAKTLERCGFAGHEGAYTVAFGASLTVGAVVAGWLVNVVGRRRLLMTGGAVLAVVYFVMGVFVDLAPDNRGAGGGGSVGHERNYASWVTVGSLLLVAPFVFNLCWGPVAWVVPSEAFPQHLRAKGMSLAVCGSWTADWLVVFTYPLLLDAVGARATWFAYGVINILAVVFVYTCVRETLGLSLEDAMALYTDGVDGSRPRSQEDPECGAPERRAEDTEGDAADERAWLVR